MKTKIKQGSATLIIMLGLSLGFTQCSEGVEVDDSLAAENADLKAALQSSSLTDSEIEAIGFMREEEKL
ncbi:MAG: hypothetical protein P8100_15155, partial [bacterium]